MDADSIVISEARLTAHPHRRNRQHGIGQMSSKFAATHIVQHSGQSYEVMLVDGAAYTQAEWDSESQADYEVNDQGEWLFQGQAFSGEVVSVSQQIADAVTAADMVCPEQCCDVLISVAESGGDWRAKLAEMVAGDATEAKSLGIED